MSYVQCSLYLVSFSVNVSIFHITWLDTFWTDYTYTHMYVYIYTHTHTMYICLQHIIIWNYLLFLFIV